MDHRERERARKPVLSLVAMVTLRMFQVGSKREACFLGPTGFARTRGLQTHHMGDRVAEAGPGGCKHRTPLAVAPRRNATFTGSRVKLTG